jgi:hypothetical protein
LADTVMFEWGACVCILRLQAQQERT